MSFRNMVTRFVENKDGNFGPMAAVAVLSLVLIAGLATDTQYMTTKQARLQSASDAIALQAFQSGARSPAELTAIAEDYLSTLYGDSELGRISIGQVRREGDEVRVVLAQDLDNDPAFFIPRPDAGVSAASNAGNAGDPINIALVLDTTGSMSGARISALMLAANRLIDQLEKVDNDQFRVSVVPFERYVNVGIANQNAPWLELPETGTWNGCVGSRLGAQASNPHFDGEPMIGVTQNCGTELLPLTRDLSVVRTKVNSLTTNGWTYLPAGLMWGWRSLENSQPFTEAQATIVDGVEPRKVMLFMTDGANTRRQNGNLHVGPNNAQTRAQANIQTELVCDSAKADDVEIYTVALEINDETTLNLVKDCASSEAQAFDAQNEAELVSAFEQIGRELGRLRLTN